jgi:hypothetical protein
MKGEDVTRGARLIEEIGSLERAKLVVSAAKDLTINTAGHTVMQAKKEDARSSFLELQACIIAGIDSRIAVARDRLAAIGVES